MRLRNTIHWVWMYRRQHMKFGELTEAEQTKFHKSVIEQNQQVTSQKPIELWPDDDDEYVINLDFIR